MSGIISRLRGMNKIENVSFAPLPTVDVTVQLGKIRFMDTLNARVDEFISVVVYGQKLYLMGFMGIATCIIREFPIKTEYRSSELPFIFSISRDILKVMDSKHELRFDLKDGLLTWSFRFGDGYIIKSMKPSSTIYDVKKYLDFILNSDIGNGGGTVNTADLKTFRKTMMAVTRDVKEYNVVLGNRVMFNVLPTFAIYQKTSVETDILLADHILSNLPRKDTEFSVKTYKGFSGLMSKETRTYFVFKSLCSNDLIEPYLNLDVKWIGALDNNIAKAIGVVSFGEEKEIELTFNKETQTVVVKDVDDERNQYISRTKVVNDGRMIINSAIRNIPYPDMLGVITSDGREHIRVLSLKGGQICLIR